MIGHVCTSSGYFSSDIGHDSVAEILHDKHTQNKQKYNCTTFYFHLFKIKQHGP